MPKLHATALGLVAALGLITASHRVALADKGPGGGQNQQVFKVEGVITAIDPTAMQVSIRTAGGSVLAVTVTAQTKIERNGREVRFSALQVGDRAQALYVAGPIAVKLEAVGP